jgi:hypothetical protein
VANIIHKIKPSITFMGIHELKDMILEIEDNAKNKKTERLKGQLDQFDQICKRAIAELKEEFSALT